MVSLTEIGLGEVSSLAAVSFVVVIVNQEFYDLGVLGDLAVIVLLASIILILAGGAKDKGLIE
jgi:hypothetical protein